MWRVGFINFKIIIIAPLIAIVGVAIIIYLYWISNSYYLNGWYTREASAIEEKEFSEIVNLYKGDLSIALIHPFGSFSVESLSSKKCNQLKSELEAFDFLTVIGCKQKPVLPNTGEPISNN